MPTEPIFYADGLSFTPQKFVESNSYSLETDISGLPIISADAGALSGSVMNPGTFDAKIFWNGFKNFSKNKAWTVLVRQKARLAWPTGSSRLGIFSLSLFIGNKDLSLSFRNTGGVQTVWHAGNSGTANAKSGTTAELASFNQDQWYDMIVSTTGLNGGAYKIWLDGVLFHSSTLTAESFWDNVDANFTSFGVGGLSFTAGSMAAFGPIDDVAIWDVFLDDIADEFRFADNSPGKLSDLSGTARVKQLLITPTPALQAKDLRKDTLVQGVLGDLVIPIANDVRKDIELDSPQVTGNIVIPVESNVADTVAYDIDKIGTREDTFVVGTADGEVVDNIAEGEVP